MLAESRGEIVGEGGVLFHPPRLTDAGWRLLLARERTLTPVFALQGQKINTFGLEGEVGIRA